MESISIQRGLWSSEKLPYFGILCFMPLGQNITGLKAMHENINLSHSWTHDRVCKMFVKEVWQIINVHNRSKMLHSFGIWSLNLVMLRWLSRTDTKSFLLQRDYETSLRGCIDCENWFWWIFVQATSWTFSNYSSRSQYTYLVKINLSRWKLSVKNS